MPRYFFHTADGGRDRDDQGVELTGPAAARIEGIKYAGDAISDHPELLWDGHDFRVEVMDERGILQFTIITLAVDAPQPEPRSREAAAND